MKLKNIIPLTGVTPEELARPCMAPRSRKEILASRLAMPPITVFVVEDVVKDESSILDKPEVGKKSLKLCGGWCKGGHSNWYTEDENAVAVEKGFCCPSGGLEGYHKHHRFWMFEEQSDLTVPKKQRRTKDHPLGVCADKVTGLYIGLKGGDCRVHTKDKTKWCEFHSPPAKVEQQEGDKVANKIT